MIKCLYIIHCGDIYNCNTQILEQSSGEVNICEYVWCMSTWSFDFVKLCCYFVNKLLHALRMLVENGIHVCSKFKFKTKNNDAKGKCPI